MDESLDKWDVMNHVRTSWWRVWTPEFALGSPYILHAHSRIATAVVAAPRGAGWVGALYEETRWPSVRLRR
jgi:hypothetical protein